MNDLVFKEKYAKMFKNTLTNLMKLYDIPKNNCLVAKDCCREDIWRNNHTTAYKATRNEVRQTDTFDPEAFTQAYDIILPELESAKICQSISIKKLEADDVIAVVTKEILKHNPQADITIITNDNDYIQLLACTSPPPENLRIINLQGKDISKRVETEVSKYLLFKTIIGDKSDNIPSIAAKIGPKTAEKLASNPDELDKLFAKNPAAKEQFDKNDLLINFEKIPVDLSDRVLKQLTLQ
jgi:5'-3' exonuclease